MTKLSGKNRITKLGCLIHGSSGRMGQQLIEALSTDNRLTLAATIDENEIKAFDEKHTAVLKYSPKALAAVIQGADVIIDFSSPKGTLTLAKALESAEGKTVLIGTTGLSKQEMNTIGKAAKKGGHKILMAGNTSLGIATMARLAQLAVKALSPAGFDIEIIETHHRMKIDAPSGTALFLANVIQATEPKLKVIFERKGKRAENTVFIHAIRGGGVVGEHSIRLISDSEEIEISHRAFSRSLFAKGALHLTADIEKRLKPGRAIELSEFIQI